MSGLYKIKTVSEMCGCSPTLLRAWESRHGLLEPVRQPSGHRLYTDDDLRVLRRVNQLLAKGQSIGEIAALGRPALLALPAQDEAGPSVSSSVPLPLLSKEIIEAAVALDEEAIRAGLDRLESLLPKRDIVRGVLPNLCREIGSLWVGGLASVASEHLLSAMLIERLRLWTSQDKAPVRDKRKVLCAGFPEEMHEIGLLSVVYELRSSGRDVLCLGAGLPFLDLEAAIGRASPAVVCLSVTRQIVYDVHRLRLAEVVQRHPEVVFVVGGTGAANIESDLIALGVTPWPAHRGLTDLPEVLR